MIQNAIDVDLQNPGQVFACLGIVEIADTLLGGAFGGFDWESAGRSRFLVASNEGAPVRRVLDFLDEAQVSIMVPAGDDPGFPPSWEAAPVKAPPGMFPIPPQDAPARLPAVIEDKGGNSVTVSHWGDGTNCDSLKFWAGMGGMPGAEILRRCLRCAQDEGILDHMERPFDLASDMPSSLRFDMRKDYIPVDLGFSLNRHSNMISRGYPLVEVLAAIGLTHARPRRIGRLHYTYGVPGTVAGDLHDPILLRASLGARFPVAPGQPLRVFSMRLGEPSGPNRARSINHVTEQLTQ